MTTSWIPATARLLLQFAQDGIPATRSYSDRDEAITVALELMEKDPVRPSIPVIVPVPIHENGAEGLSPQLAFEGEIIFDYINWRGEHAIRRAKGPYAIRYGTSDFHTEPQFLLSAIDCDKQETREYALREMVPIVVQ